MLKDYKMLRTCHKFQSGDISVFETNIRYVGGLLSAYALTGDDMFRDKALHVAEKLTPAFKSPTGIPFALINMRTGVSRLKNSTFSKKIFQTRRVVITKKSF